MSRTRSFDRESALDTAMRLFWERGYDNTSISDLTDAIGIAPPSLYAAFGSKQQLFDEATERYQQMPGNITTLALDEPTVRGAITRLLHDAAIEYTKSGQPRGCMILGEPLLGEHRKRSRVTLQKRIQRGVDAGELPSGASAGTLADYVSVVLAGLSARARDGASRRELLRVADAAMAAWPEPASA